MANKVNKGAGMGKAIIGIYIFIGILFAPLVYSNNGGGHIFHGGYGIGQNIGTSIAYWPSYVFAWEPEVNGNSDEEFAQSISDMLQWRRDKFFAPKRAPYTDALLSSIGACILYETSGSARRDISALYKELFNNEEKMTPHLDKIRASTRDRFDGMDFKDVLDEGESCLNKN